ncbi:alpha/beta fold hydrolase [Polaromonas sp.]|uniref:esterase/lipase family protein n=1 Tax=Polaromonas sp. TaxID=1869339 RepID=UPI0018412E26|nr:alpha/beta fold hydrolase [Polaromonas sp.]NML84856.1 alpha/beta fold hydrolase [Polaromonas sp.]
MLASLQRFLTLALLTAAFGWLLYFGLGSPVLAVTGFVAMMLAYSAFFAVEFLLLRQVNKADPTPQASCRELLRAWWGETLTSPQVFCWRQPFRSQATPDQLSPPERFQGRRGVVFVHGFFCNRGLWTPWLKRLEGGGHAFVAVNLEPIFGSIDDYAAQIDAAVRQVTQTTGLPPLLVCHSMGGLAARAWLKGMKAESRVHHVVTIGTPHRGTWLARFGHGHNGRQMRLQSDWHAQLDQGMPSTRHALFTCWYSSCDNIVFPASTATLPGADNRLVRGAAHMQLAFVPEVMDATLALLENPMR